MEENNLKKELNKSYVTISGYAFAVIILSIAFFQLISNLSAVNNWIYGILKPIFPIFYGFIIAYLLDPIMMAIERYMVKLSFFKNAKRKKIRGISLLLTYIFAIALFVVFLLIVMPRVIESLSNMVMQLQDYVSWAQQTVTSIFEGIPEGLIPDAYIKQLNDQIGQAVTDFISLIGNSIPLLVGLLVNISNGVINAVVGIIISCYLLFSKETFIAQIKKVAISLMKADKIAEVSKLISTTDHMFGRFITGKIIDSFIIGFLCFIGLSLLKIPNTVLVSFIVGITNIIPYFGPFLGAIPSFVLIAFISPAKGIIFLVFVLFLQQLDGNVIGPMILGDTTGLSAFWVVFAILLFGGAFGIVGMIIGVPTMGVIFWVVKNKLAVLLKKKDLPYETEFYEKPIGEILEIVSQKQIEDKKD